MTVTPEHDDYKFEPGERTVTITDAGDPVDFTGTPRTPVSGTVVDDDDDPVPDVTIRITYGGTTEEVTTDADGAWGYADSLGEVTVEALDPAYDFAGSPRTATFVANDVDFEGELKACSSGDSSDEHDPCELTRIKQVQNIREHLAGFYKLGDDIDASATEGWHVDAGSDEAQGFEPIGREQDEFTGRLDGTGKQISNLYIYRPDDDGVGLFGRIGNDGRVENLTLTDATVEGGGSVGAIAGRSSGVIEGVHVGGQSSVTGNSDVGGVVGHNAGGVVEHSYNEGSVDAADSTEWSIGGVIGFNDEGTVDTVYNTGAVTGKSWYTGGVVGRSEGSSAMIKYSYNEGTVNGRQGTGGVAGLSHYGTVQNSYNIASVSGGISTGGLVGEFRGTVVNSYNAGIVESNSDPGGLIGLATGSAGTPVTASFWDVTVTEIDQGTRAPDEYGLGKSKTEMQTQATFEDAGWDFTDVWHIDEGHGYPDLLNNPRY